MRCTVSDTTSHADGSFATSLTAFHGRLMGTGHDHAFSVSPTKSKVESFLAQTCIGAYVERRGAPRPSLSVLPRPSHTPLLVKLGRVVRTTSWKHQVQALPDLEAEPLIESYRVHGAFEDDSQAI